MGSANPGLVNSLQIKRHAVGDGLLDVPRGTILRIRIGFRQIRTGCRRVVEDADPYKV